MNMIDRGAATVAASMDGLDPWLEKVGAIGELQRISAEVDPELEMSTITYM